MLSQNETIMFGVNFESLQLARKTYLRLNIFVTKTLLMNRKHAKFYTTLWNQNEHGFHLETPAIFPLQQRWSTESFQNDLFPLL